MTMVIIIYSPMSWLRWRGVTGKCRELGIEQCHLFVIKCDKDFEITREPEEGSTSFGQ